MAKVGDVAMKQRCEYRIIAEVDLDEGVIADSNLTRRAVKLGSLLSPEGNSGLCTYFNQLAGEGWELVFVAEQRYIFRRPMGCPD
jgi:hypothetical protein